MFLAKLQVPAICLGLVALFALATGAAIHSFDRDQASRTTESAPRFAEGLIAGTGQIFRTYGIAPGRSVTLLPDGCLLDLNQAASWGHVGVRSTAELRGDMHFEARFEILNAPVRVDAGYGAHIGLALNTGNKAGGAGAVNRGVFQGKGNQYDACRWLRINDRLRYPTSYAPTQAFSGRLAVRRIGTEVIMLVADDPTAELAEIERYPFTNAPIQALLIYGDTGGARVDLQARIFDAKLFVGTDIPKVERLGIFKVSFRSLPVTRRPNQFPRIRSIQPRPPARAQRLRSSLAPGCRS